MATQMVDVRSDRLVVLVSKAEKAALSERAQASGMTVSEFIRTAAERYSEPTEAEQRLMSELLTMLEQANVKTDAALARLQATEARVAAFDEDAYRAKVEAELAARTDLDWSAMAMQLGIGRA